MWDTALARLTEECFSNATKQLADIRKYFIATLKARLTGLAAPAPHANCNKIIASRAPAIFVTLSTQVDALVSEAIQDQRQTLLKLAYDQACIDVEARYPSLLKDTLAAQRDELLNTERARVTALQAEAANLVKSEFD